MATWKSSSAERKDSKEEETPTVNGHNGTLEDVQDRSLTWDTDGKKLAFGFGNQVCIANFVLSLNSKTNRVPIVGNHQPATVTLHHC